MKAKHYFYRIGQSMYDRHQPMPKAIYYRHLPDWAIQHMQDGWLLASRRDK